MERRTTLLQTFFSTIHVIVHYQGSRYVMSMSPSSLAVNRSRRGNSKSERTSQGIFHCKRTAAVSLSASPFLFFLSFFFSNKSKGDEAEENRRTYILGPLPTSRATAWKSWLARTCCRAMSLHVTWCRKPDVSRRVESRSNCK